MKIMNVLAVLIFTVSCACSALAQAPATKPDAKKGKVEYPADGVIDFNQGTFEIWFKPLFDMSARPSGQEIQCFLLYVGTANDQGLKVLCENVRTGGSIRVSSNFIKNPMAVNQEKLAWKPDEWHHFAMTWKYVDDPAPDKRNIQFVFYADGKEYLKNDNPLKGELPSASSYVVRLGDPRYNNKALFDAVRFSSKARTAEEISASFNGGPKTDADTTLMDNFDRIQVLDKSRTNTMPDGKIKGIISGTYEKVLGKYGNALKLSSEKF